MPESETSLVKTCNTCGNVVAIDLDPTPERWQQMQQNGHTVRTLPTPEALELWKTAARCDHAKLIRELRGKLAGK